MKKILYRIGISLGAMILLALIIFIPYYVGLSILWNSENAFPPLVWIVGIVSIFSYLIGGSVIIVAIIWWIYWIFTGKNISLISDN